MDTGLTLLAHAHVAFRYWSYSFRTAINCINLLPTPVLQNQFPHENLYGQPPKYNDSKIFGCAIYFYLHQYTKNKFSYRSKKCVYLGNTSDHAGYNCLDINSNRVYLAKHVVFD